MHGFTENSNPGSISLSRNTAYTNTDDGFYFEVSSSTLTSNIAVSNGTGAAQTGSSVTATGNTWNSGVSTPSFSTDATTAYAARKSDHGLPDTSFLVPTNGAAIGATMR
jgi:parallel beta-helix repeat protein